MQASGVQSGGMQSNGRARDVDGLQGGGPHPGLPAGGMAAEVGQLMAKLIQSRGHGKCAPSCFRLPPVAKKKTEKGLPAPPPHALMSSPQPSLAGMLP